MVFLSETDDSRFGLIGSEAIMVFLSETDDSRFGLIGSEAIMVFGANLFSFPVDRAMR